MENRYVKVVLTVIAVCLLWLSVKDIFVTKIITKKQLEAIIEFSEPSVVKAIEGGAELKLGENYFFELPVDIKEGSVSVDNVVEIEGSGSYQTPVKIAIED